MLSEVFVFNDRWFSQRAAVPCSPSQPLCTLTGWKDCARLSEQQTITEMDWVIQTGHNCGVCEKKTNKTFDVSPQLIRWQHVTVTVCSVRPWPKESQGCGGHLGSSFSLRHLQGVVTLGQLALDSKCGGDFSRRHQGCFRSNLHLDSNKADAATLLIFRMCLSGSPWKQLLPWLSSIRFSLDPYDDEFAITQAHQDVAVAVGEGEALDLNQKLQRWQGLQSARSGRERHKQFSVSPQCIQSYFFP